MNNNSTSKTQELAGVSPGTQELTNANRNSWAQQYDSRQSVLLLGKVVELDEWLDWRMKWGQRGGVVGGGLSLLFYVLNSTIFSGKNVPVFVACVVFAVSCGLSFLMIYYKNFSFVIARRLLKEVNVVMILVLGICIFTIDISKPYNSFSPINGFVYLLLVTLVLFIDAMKKKTRVFILVVGNLFALVSLYLIYDRTFNGTDAGVILVQYGDDYVFHKRSIKRSIFIQTLLFNLNGMWTMFKDKKMEKMMFALDNIYRERGMISQRETLLWRVKWGQRGAAASASLGLLLFMFYAAFFRNNNLPLYVGFTVCSVVFLIAIGIVYYKNISFTIAGTLLKEVNVVMIVFLAICNFVINCIKSSSFFSPINAFIYFVMVILFVFLDAIKKKSRIFVIFISIIFALMNLFVIFQRIFLDTEQGVILFRYGDDYVFYKRSIKRSIFIQIFLFSLNGMWTMFKDKKMEKMMFATEHIYRETGTASKHVYANVK